MSTTNRISEQKLVDFQKLADYNNSLQLVMERQDLKDLLFEVFHLRNEVKRLQQMQPRY